MIFGRHKWIRSREYLPLEFGWEEIRWGPCSALGPQKTLVFWFVYPLLEQT